MVSTGSLSRMKDWHMARRPPKKTSRVELRKAAEAAEQMEAMESQGDSAKKAAAKKTVKKKKAVRRKSSKKAELQRMRMVWGVFDNSNQQVATFPYPEREAAEKKATDLNDKGRGPFFVQPVKEPMPEEPPASGEET